MLGRKITAGQIAKVAGPWLKTANIDVITRLSGRVS
jgi:hypothetical protein